MKQADLSFRTGTNAEFFVFSGRSAASQKQADGFTAALSKIQI